MTLSGMGMNNCLWLLIKSYSKIWAQTTKEGSTVAEDQWILKLLRMMRLMMAESTGASIVEPEESFFDLGGNDPYA
ncbi:hypothetical protein C8J56DRAFT_1048884 [Mycena floridula]|nr:hypothetical protein C8J56DRAFT_1048884 [Mycena floridula]